MIEKEQLPELIYLQAAHITQYTNNGVKGDWFVRKNVTNEDMFTFPPNISDELMRQIMNFAKKYELEAFNAGIKFQKDKQNECLVSQIKDLERINKEFVHENERLATILEQHIGE